MTGVIIADDYLDPDVAYLLGMIVARGTLVERAALREIIIEFPYQNLNIEIDDEDRHRSIDIPQSIELGLGRIRERVLELLDCDIKINRFDNSLHMVLTMTRRTMSWRNILLHLGDKTNFRVMNVPEMLFHPSITTDIRMEFIRGYADVAGNIRRANRYIDGRNRVRLDVLNDNWQLPVQLCRLLQIDLDVPVQNVTWGHPNLGRNLREHQINIFATPFSRIGFSFSHKQEVLQHFIEQDSDKNEDYKPCPGRRRTRGKKPTDPDENSSRLPEPVRKHFDSYWQICKAMGCLVEPEPGPLFSAVNEDIEET
jgi:hypothetical protein